MSDYVYNYTGTNGATRSLGRAEAARRVGGRLALRRLQSDARRQGRASGQAVTGGRLDVQRRRP